MKNCPASLFSNQGIKAYLSVALLTSVLASVSHCEELPTLFTGHDFTFWQEPEGNQWWTAKDGELCVKNNLEKQGSTLWSQKDYKNFVLEFEFLLGEGNIDSGIFIRHENDQIQIGVSGSLKRDMTGSPYIVSKKSYPAEANNVAKLLKPKDWNAMTILVKGNTYSIWLNGASILIYDSETAIESGPIGIQLHQGRTMSMKFREIRLAELK